MGSNTIKGAGIGLRQPLIPALLNQSQQVDFLELAPENWMGIGGHRKKQLRALSEIYPMICHGLSLSLGGMAELNIDFLKSIKRFMKEHEIFHFSEHICFSGYHGLLYDLFPLPFTEEAIHHISQQIRIAQKILETKIAIENIAYYNIPQAEMSEEEFICSILSEADCYLLLDVNNIYVNSVNHQYDPYQYIDSLCEAKITYFHLAGHLDSDDLKIDSHGEPVADQVWELLKYCYQKLGPTPTLLERDSNIPPLEELSLELVKVRKLQAESKEAHD